MFELSVVISTKQRNEYFISHIKATSGFKENIEVLVYENNNEYSLSELYNKGLKESQSNIVLFIHDDIIFETPYWGKKLLNHFKRNPEYGIIGIAGTTHLINGKWWTLRKNMVGSLNHVQNNRKYLTQYSPLQGNKLKDVVTIDGVFMCVDKNKIKSNFNEDFKGFHFYDIPFCVDNYLSGVKIGVVTDIVITHKSIGVVNKSWGDSKLQFEKEYINKLPLISGKKDIQKPSFNILIRTSNREVGFNNILSQLKSQTYQNFTLYVSVDNQASYDYVIKAGIPKENIVFIDKSTLKQPITLNLKEEIYNLYFNDLYRIMGDGYVWHIDDDDELTNNFVLEIISNSITKDDNIYIYKMNLMNHIIPSRSWGGKITLGDIGTPNFIVHSKHCKLVKWDGYTWADGRFIQNINKLLYNIVWVDEVIYNVNQVNHGK